MYTKLKVLGELLIEFLVVFSIFLDFSEHLEAFLDDVLLYNLQNLILLESLSRNVKWEIFRVDYTLNK